MANQTVLQEVKARMQEMQDKKAKELQEIHEKKTKAQTEKEAADLTLKEATASMNLEAYEEARAALVKAQTAIDMYSGKYSQLSKQEYITEAESDKVIDDLLDYEKQIAEDFRAAIEEPIKALATILQDYQHEVNDTENTIKAWNTNIHANYRTRGRSIFTDAEGQKTDRSTQPVPVHNITYTGCREAHQLEEYLNRAAGSF